jgi:hypothetical protein
MQRTSTRRRLLALMLTLLGLVAFCAIGSWSGEHADKERVFGVRLFDTRITNPDFASLENLEFGEDNGTIDEIARVLDISKKCRLGYRYRNRYYLVEFDPRTILAEPKLSQYFKDSERASEKVGIYSEFVINFVEDGWVLSPFEQTTISPSPEPSNADFLHKVE